MSKKLFVPLLLLLLGSRLCAYFDAEINATRCYIIDRSHHAQKSMTRKYYRMLESIDYYFGESDDINISCYKKIRKSRMQIIFSVNDEGSVNIRLRGKIVLPQLQKRAELTFSQKDNEDVDTQSASSGHDDVIKDDKLHVGLKYYLYRKKRSSAYAKLNLKIASHFGPYLKLGIDKSYLSDTFLETSFENALYYYLNGNDFAASTQLTFYKPLTADYWLGQGNKLFWEGEDKLYLTNNIILYQIFDLNNRISYRTDFTTSYDPTEKLQHDSCSFSTPYFHRFDKWFFAELIPKIRKARSHHYKNELLFTFNLGVLLGK